MARFLIACLLGALAWMPDQGAAAPPPLIEAQGATEVAFVTQAMALFDAPADRSDPERLWSGALVARAPAGDHAPVGQGLVARARLRLGPQPQVLQIPSSRLDRATLWTRTPGAAWQSATAGDRVALDHWPVFGQFPSFPLPAGDVDVVLLLENDGQQLAVSVALWPDQVFREFRVRQSNLSGIGIGLGLMVSVICLIWARVARTRSGWVLAALSVWAILSVMAVNGYAAIWLLPHSPVLNDASKPLSALVLCTLFVWALAWTLDEPGPGWRSTLAGLAALIASAAIGVAAVINAGWPRVPIVVGFALAAVLAAGALCLYSYLRSGRWVWWGWLSVLATALSMFLALTGTRLVAGLDLTSIASALLLYASVLLLRHAQFNRLRHGRDVMRRVRTDEARDPLTGLWSLQGMEQVLAEARLRANATQRESSALVVLLPGLGASSNDLGFERTERALVRLAAVLQAVLGDRWSVGRLSRDAFCALANEPLSPGKLSATATLLLARFSRSRLPPTLLEQFDLRIATSATIPRYGDLPALVKEAADVLQHLPGKRIVALEGRTPDT